ncbi:hypothetical protein [Bacillus sp. NEAU-Y102]
MADVAFSWVRENREKLDKEDVEKLSRVHYFDMIDKGSTLEVMDFMSLGESVVSIYRKYN